MFTFQIYTLCAPARSTQIITFAKMIICRGSTNKHMNDQDRRYAVTAELPLQRRVQAQAQHLGAAATLLVALQVASKSVPHILTFLVPFRMPILREHQLQLIF